MKGSTGKQILAHCKKNLSNNWNIPPPTTPALQPPRGTPVSFGNSFPACIGHAPAAKDVVKEGRPRKAGSDRLPSNSHFLFHFPWPQSTLSTLPWCPTAEPVGGVGPQQGDHLSSYLLQETQMRPMETESFTGGYSSDNLSKCLRELQFRVFWGRVSKK